MIETHIITLHDISGDAILVNLDKLAYVRQSDNYCIIYFDGGLSAKVVETLNEIGKYVSAKKNIG
jgi:hypothetical protein